MNNVLQNLMRQATQLTQAGRLNEATAAIQSALKGAKRDKTKPYEVVADEDLPAKPAPSGIILDGCVFETTGGDTVKGQATGEFTSGTHTHAMLTRRYKLYVPPGSAGKQRTLVVMLHGCTQNPDDFAVGTGMNERAREQGFCVLYPEQSQDANPQRCWNWFKHNHQRRGRGEPALIASMTQTVMKQHDIDPRRVYIAGLSAGGAMAAIVADAYPEIFAAVGVHSGLPTGSAGSVPEALSVMNSGQSGIGRPPIRATQPPQQPQRLVPTIVFHGDQDRTVHPRNGEQVIASALGSTAAAKPRVTQGVSTNGRRYTSATHHGDAGEVLAEHWLVHGAGHAWSGGHAKGSYTDAKGPDATAEMLRFFFAHPHNK
ncbi:MAG: PHB depolymerase family esterase [Burkholderiaceae bacterium]